MQTATDFGKGWKVSCRGRGGCPCKDFSYLGTSGAAQFLAVLYTLGLFLNLCIL